MTLPAALQTQVLAAAQALRRGGLVAYPTETVYGLGADPRQESALHALLRLKGRGAEKGLILLVAGVEAVTQAALPPSPLARHLMESFWPGPLTLVLPARPDLSRLVTGSGGWVALRHSPSPVVAALLERFGAPIVSTSANPSGQPTPVHGAEIRRLWGEALAGVVELPHGTAQASRPSTVVKVEGEGVTLLREGALAAEEVRRAVAAWGDPNSRRG